jgi:hypothetical protein
MQADQTKGPGAHLGAEGWRSAEEEEVLHPRHVVAFPMCTKSDFSNCKVLGDEHI